MAKKPIFVDMSDGGDIQPPKKKRSLRQTFSLVMFVGFCLAILSAFAVLIFYQAGVYNEMRAELEQIQANIEAEREIMQRLELNLEFFDSDAYVERLAREMLGMVHPGEIVFRNVVE